MMPAHAADRGPLAGRRVIVCRAADDAGPLADALRDRGAEPVLVPLLVRDAPADGGAALRHAVAHLDRYAWVAVTSAAGADAFLAALPPLNPDTGSPVPAPGVTAPGRRTAGVRVAAVGPATADALRRAGVEPDLVPATATAADLAAAFPPAPAEGARVLAPLAELAGDDLVAGLRARGWTVDRVDAYRLADLPPLASADALPAGLVGADAVAFTSPSTVDRFCDRFGRSLVPPVVACIGPRTAERARTRGLAGVVTAGEHTGPGLVAALATALANAPRTGVRPAGDGS